MNSFVPPRWNIWTAVYYNLFYIRTHWWAWKTRGIMVGRAAKLNMNHFLQNGSFLMALHGERRKPSVKAHKTEAFQTQQTLGLRSVFGWSIPVQYGIFKHHKHKAYHFITFLKIVSCEAPWSLWTHSWTCVKSWGRLKSSFIEPALLGSSLLTGATQT